MPKSTTSGLHLDVREVVVVAGTLGIFFHGGTVSKLMGDGR